MTALLLLVNVLYLLVKRSESAYFLQDHVPDVLLAWRELRLLQASSAVGVLVCQRLQVAEASLVLQRAIPEGPISPREVRLRDRGAALRVDDLRASHVRRWVVRHLVIEEFVV